MQSNLFPAFIQVTSDTTDIDRLEGKLRDVARSAPDEFGRAFNQVGAVVTDALSRVRNAVGSLDLGGGDQFRQAAAEQRAYADAAREVAAAMQRVGTSSQAEIAAMQALILKHEEGERAALDQAKAYDLLQAELNKTKSATDAVVSQVGRGTTAYQANTQSVRAMRQATTQAGQQLQDIVISMGSGQRASTVLAQQLPQLAFAFSDVGGKVGAVARFLSGPWGVAVALGAFALGPFIDGLFGAGDATDKLSKSNRTLIDVLQDEKSSLEEVIKALDEYYRSKERARQSSILEAQAAALAVESKLNEAAAIREAIKAKIEELDVVARSGGLEDAFAASVRTGQLESELAAQDAKINDLLKKSRSAVLDVAEEIAKISSSSETGIKTGFDILRDEARKSIKDVKALADELTKLNKAEQAALEAANKSGRTGKSPSYADGVATFKSREQAIGFLGKQLQSSGFRVSENDQFGGVKGNHPGMGNAAHGRYAVDVNVGRGIIEADNPIAKAQIDAAARQYQAIGFRVLWNGQIYEPFGDGPGKLIPKGKDQHRDHAHFEAPQSIVGRPVSKSESAAKAVSDAAQEAQQFQSEMDRIGLTIQSITGQFDEQPRLIDRANLAAEKLRIIIAGINAYLTEPDLGEEQRKALEAARMEAEKAQKVVAEGVNGPLRDMLRLSEEQAQIDDLRLQGRNFEADVLQRILGLQSQMGPLTEAQADQVTATLAAEQQRIIALERINRIQQRNLDIVQQTQGNVRSTVRELLDGKGVGAIGNFFSRAFDGYLDALADEITDGIFGDIGEQQKARILGYDKVKDASEEVARVSNTAAQQIAALGDAAAVAAGKFDPDAGIIVNGKRAANDNATQRSVNQVIRDTFKDLGKKIFGDQVAADISQAFQGVMQSVALGQTSSGILRSVGIKQSKLGSQIGGAIGGAVAGPLGALAGGIIGGTFGGLFKKTPRGAATITQDGSTVTGSKKLREGLGSAGSGVSDTISRIADALGGDVGAFSVAIKQKGKKYTVNGQKFTDPEEATRAAILAAINQGAVTGIRQGAQNLLRAGKDIEAALDKATKFQTIFDRLLEYEDPAAAALQKLNREFESLRKIAIEAGEGLVEVEKLYGLERAKVVEELTQRLTGSLQDLIDDLKMGDNGLSLRDRQAAILAQYSPMANAIRAGQTVDADKFAEIARQLLDINRQIYGSQGGYFASFNDVIALSEKAIAQQKAAIEAAGGSSPFTSTTASADGTAPVVGAINGQTQQLINSYNQMIGLFTAMNDNLSTISANSYGSGGGRPVIGNMALLQF